VSCDYCGVVNSFHGLSGQQQMPCVNCGKKLNLQAAVIVPPIVNNNAKKATTKGHSGNQTSANNLSKNVLFKDLSEIGSQGEINQGIWSHFWVNHIIPMERDRKLT
jgi:hypothetical protein